MRTKALLTLGVPVLLWLLFLDPYSHGFVGGDNSSLFDATMSRRLPNHPWQMWAAGALAALLLSAVVAAFVTPPWVLPLFAIEASTFVALNIIYIARDGFWKRAEIGYASALPIIVASLGLLLRIVLLILIARSSAPAPRLISDGSGLQYMRNRYYDPQTARFTREGPITLGAG